MHTDNTSSLKTWQVSHFAVLSYKLLLHTICNALTLVLHSINKQKSNETYKQKNNKKYSKLMFFQCSQHKTILLQQCLVFSIILSISCMLILHLFILTLRYCTLCCGVQFLLLLIFCNINPLKQQGFDTQSIHEKHKTMLKIRILHVFFAGMK
jgi:hypothetical protein